MVPFRWLVVVVVSFCVVPAEGGKRVWSRVPAPFTIDSFALDPFNPRGMYALARSGSSYSVQRTKDDGQTWQDISRGRISLLNGTTLHPSRFAPDTLFVIHNLGEIHRTSNGGETWATASLEAKYWPTSDLSIAPGVIFLATSDGVLASVNSGKSFHPRGLAGTAISKVIAIDASRVIAAGGTHLYSSADGGTTWKEITPDTLVTNIASITADRPGTALYVQGYYNAFANGYYRSADGGTSWQFFRMGDSSFANMTVAPLEPSLVLAALGAGMLLSRDGAATWTPLNEGLPMSAKGVESIAISDDSRTYYAHTGGSVYRFDDWGRRRPAKR